MAPSFPGDGLQNLARRGGIVGKEKEVEPKNQKQQPQQKAELWMISWISHIIYSEMPGKGFPMSYPDLEGWILRGLKGILIAKDKG